jgi:hypothetical protein
VTAALAPPCRIRPARVDEAPALTALCRRSKAVWGYDAAFMALAGPALRVTPEAIAAGDVWVAEEDGTRAGVVALAPAGSARHRRMAESPPGPDAARLRDRLSGGGGPRSR